MMIPSSVCSACTSIPPYRSRSRAVMASAHGACTRSPYGLCSTTRQSPSSSRKRSTTSVLSSGTWPVACRWSARYLTRFRAASSSRPLPTRLVIAVSSGSAASSRSFAPIALPSSAGRPGVSPCQNGSLPGCPGAGSTITRSGVMSSIRQELAPSTNTSPTRDSYTISSSSSPTRLGCLLSAAGRNTPKSPRSGIVPPLVTASLCAPGLPWITPATRSQTSRGRSPANSSPGYRPASMSSTASSTGLVSPPNGAARRTTASSSSTGQSSSAAIATICWASTSSGLRGTRSSSICPSRIRPAATAARRRSPAYLGKMTPREMSPTLCPARPTRCRPLATEGGDSTWMTRSTAPMSMPSSRLEVATTAGRRPAFSASSICARACRGAGLGHDLRRDGGGGRRGRRRALLGRGRLLGTLGGELVEPAAQPFGKSAGVGEDDGGPVLPDEIEHPLLHVRPDRALGGGRRHGRDGAIRPRRADEDGRHAVRATVGRDRAGCVEVRHVLDRHHDLDLHLLAARWGGDRDRPGPAQERRHLLGRPDGRRQADPLGGAASRVLPTGTVGGGGPRTRRGA